MMKAHDRLTPEQAAWLNAIGFNEPCTKSFPAYKMIMRNKKKQKELFSIQVPTVFHAVDYIERTYKQTLSIENFNEEFENLLKKMKKK